MCFVAKKTNAGEDTRNLGSYDTVHFLVVFTATWLSIGDLGVRPWVIHPKDGPI